MEKFHIEFVLGEISSNSLWNMIGTPGGLAEWFADKVEVADERHYTFTWNKTEAQANLIASKQLSHIRLQWDENEGEDVYFELRIHQLELTHDITLEITDFAEPDEKADQIRLWEKQVETLKRKLGA